MIRRKHGGIMTKGIERVKNPRPLEDGVVVRDSGDNEWEIAESEYLRRGYQPPVENLPWRR